MATTVNKTKKPSAKKTTASSSVKTTEAAQTKTSVSAQNTAETTAVKKTAVKKTTAKKASAKTTAAKTPAKTTAKKAAKLLCVDFPKTNDTVYCGHYCFRLGSATPAEWVKISLNGGPWMDCRPSNGYWWLDWWNFETGTFVMEAVAYINGKEEKAAKTTFKVVL